jgi:hypothetical protein
LGERLGLLYSALGFGEWLRPGVLDVWAGTRGCIVAVRCGLVASTGGAAVLLPCRGAGTNGVRRRPVTRASGGRGGREKRKGGVVVRRLSRGGDERRRTAKRAGRGRLREEEGKADKRAPLVSCPGKGKVKGRAGGGWRAGPCALRGERRGGLG